MTFNSRRLSIYVMILVASFTLCSCDGSAERIRKENEAIMESQRSNSRSFEIIIKKKYIEKFDGEDLYRLEIISRQISPDTTEWDDFSENVNINQYNFFQVDKCYICDRPVIGWETPKSNLHNNYGTREKTQ